jgi:predicted MPP superfamily phosphohydrolase
MFSRPHIDYLELPCEHLPRAFDGISLLHLSDLHLTRWTSRLEKWRDALAQLNPDIAVITGDLGHRSWKWETSLISLQRLLEPLAPPLGTYFILGNHDSAKLGPALAQTKDTRGHARVLLQNEVVFLQKTSHAIEVQIPNAPTRKSKIENRKSQPRLALIGIHQHRRIDTDIPLALRAGGVTPADFKLMLLHYPDLVYPAAAAGADVCLAGHTHGGQICWPDGRPLFRQDTLSAPQCTGVHRVNGTWMIVNRGIGAAGLRVRVFCPPQAVLMTLRTARERVL